MEDIKNIEKGIPIMEFSEISETKNKEMEFRVKMKLIYYYM